MRRYCSMYFHIHIYLLQQPYQVEIIIIVHITDEETETQRG